MVVQSIRRNGVIWVTDIRLIGRASQRDVTSREVSWRKQPNCVTAPIPNARASFGRANSGTSQGSRSSTGGPEDEGRFLAASLLTDATSGGAFERFRNRGPLLCSFIAAPQH